MIIANDTRLHLESAGFSPDDLLLVAVSGGPDSLVLAHVLHSLKWKIALAHFDHQLREQSAADCQFVKETADSFKVAFYAGREDVQLKAGQEKRSIEDAARAYRYGFIFDTAEKIGAKAVLTAHTADDQIETVLMHLIRGSGLRGLAGMQLSAISEFHPRIPLVRPMLTVWREDIEKYCRENRLNPVQDASNQEVTYFRNRIRHELIPDLETYNPAVKDNLLHLTEIVQDDWSFLEKQYTQLFEKLFIQKNPDSISISVKELQKLDKGAQKALMVRGLNFIMQQPQDQVEYRTIDAILQFMLQPTKTNHITMPAHCHAFLEKDHLIFTRFSQVPFFRDFPQCSGTQTIPTDGSFEIKISPCFKLSGRFESMDQYQQPELEEGFLWECYLAAENISGRKAVVRAFRSGERYAPLGMDGKEIKVSDFFTNKKIPVPIRKNWPLVLVEDEVAWIPGFQPAHTFRFQKDTGRVWHLQLIKDKEFNQPFDSIPAASF